jgi:hypothetical protein
MTLRGFSRPAKTEGIGRGVQLLFCPGAKPDGKGAVYGIWFMEPSRDGKLN